MKKGLVGCMGLLMVGLSTTSQATLIDRGNGMIYDSDQDLTWLQDANYANTSSGYRYIGGRMNWDQAVAWADNLIFGGFDDWRLPTVIDEKGQGFYHKVSGGNAGYNVDTTASELAYMFYINLGNGSRFNPDSTRNVDGCPDTYPGCLQNTSADGVDIMNLQAGMYWTTGTEYPNDPLYVLGFGTQAGSQNLNEKSNRGYVWAVRDGDVAAASVPEPGTLVLMMAGMAGLGVAGRKQAAKGR